MISPSSLNWHQQKSYCNSQGGYLVEVKSVQEHNALENVLQAAMTYLWTGGNDLAKQGKYRWAHSNTAFSFGALGQDWKQTFNLPNYPKAIAAPAAHHLH